jgi:hypothetical protein
VPALSKEVWYLGHTVSPEGVTINLEELKAVQERSTLKNKDLPGPMYLLQVVYLQLH